MKATTEAASGVCGVSYAISVKSLFLIVVLIYLTFILIGLSDVLPAD